LKATKLLKESMLLQPLIEIDERSMFYQMSVINET